MMNDDLWEEVTGMKPNSLVQALDDAFQQVRGQELTLAARLSLIADQVRRLSPVFAEQVDCFVTRLEMAGAGAMAPRVGERMPGFLLPDDTGRLTSLDELITDAPVAIAFHRGHWCPYCRLNMVGLTEIEAQIAPARIVAISAEKQQYTKALKAEAQARFPFLTDFGNGYALSLNLAVWVDDTMASLIGGAGWDIPGYQGTDAWILPVPAVFVVDRSGIIRARHVDPDYRRRMELSDLVSAVQSAFESPRSSPRRAAD